VAKVICLGWVKEDDPRYQEGWTVSATLGLNERATQGAGGGGEDTAGTKTPPPRKKRASSRRTKRR